LKDIRYGIAHFFTFDSLNKTPDHEYP
jgi:hypothetical protein